MTKPSTFGYRKGLDIALEIGDRAGEGRAYHCLSIEDTREQSTNEGMSQGATIVAHDQEQREEKAHLLN